MNTEPLFFCLGRGVQGVSEHSLAGGEGGRRPAFRWPVGWPLGAVGVYVDSMMGMWFPSLPGKERRYYRCIPLDGLRERMWLRALVRNSFTGYQEFWNLNHTPFFTALAALLSVPMATVTGT